MEALAKRFSCLHLRLHYHSASKPCKGYPLFFSIYASKANNLICLSVDMRNYTGSQLYGCSQLTCCCFPPISPASSYIAAIHLHKQIVEKEKVELRRRERIESKQGTEDGFGCLSHWGGRSFSSKVGQPLPPRPLSSVSLHSVVPAVRKLLRHATLIKESGSVICMVNLLIFFFVDIL